VRDGNGNSKSSNHDDGDSSELFARCPFMVMVASVAQPILYLSLPTPVVSSERAPPRAARVFSANVGLAPAVCILTSTSLRSHPPPLTGQHHRYRRLREVLAQSSPLPMQVILTSHMKTVWLGPRTLQPPFQRRTASDILRPVMLSNKRLAVLHTMHSSSQTASSAHPSCIGS
jgi:hypothetical protein